MRREPRLTEQQGQAFCFFSFLLQLFPGPLAAEGITRYIPVWSVNNHFSPPQENLLCLAFSCLFLVGEDSQIDARTFASISVKLLCNHISSRLGSPYIAVGRAGFI